MQTIAVHLTEEEQRRLILTQKYFILLGLLEKIGAMEIRSGYVQINFDSAGRILGIDKHEHLNV